MKNKNLIEMDEVVNAIKNNKEFTIAYHISPDGDCIGSALGLGLALKKIGKSVTFAAIDSIPDYLKFLPKIDLFTPVDKVNGILITVDVSDKGRLGEFQDKIEKAVKVINIDHHKSNDLFGDINLVMPKMSSSGELVFNIIKELNVDLDNEISTAIFTAISSDTGSFMYDSTTPKTLKIASKLAKHIKNYNEITINLYQSRTMNYKRVLNYVLNSLQLFNSGRVAIGIVTSEQLASINAKPEDTEGVVNFLIDTEGIEVAIFIKANESNMYKISARSKTDFDVSKLCEKFGGGGHKKAAGCQISGDISSVKQNIIDEINKLGM